MRGLAPHDQGALRVPTAAPEGRGPAPALMTVPASSPKNTGCFSGRSACSPSALGGLSGGSQRCFLAPCWVWQGR